MPRLSGLICVRAVRAVLRRLGIDIVRYVPPPASTAFPPDFGQDDIDTFKAVAPYTMCAPEAVLSLCDAVRYIVTNHIPGALVECGVWRGGSTMAAIRTLLEVGDQSRDVYLFDTFEGMSPPSAKDVDFTGTQAGDLMAQSRLESLVWAYSPLHETRRAVLSLGYPSEGIHFVKGMVEDTIPDLAPPRISLLRLDTDWHSSTLHELTHLFPRLSPGGVIIIDDYGHWRGAREATDEYLRTSKERLLLNRVNYTVRIGVKA